MTRYSMLTIAETDPALLVELGLGVEGSIKANGDVVLPEHASPYLVSVHLPYSLDGRRFNVGASDEAVRRGAIESVKAAIDRAKLLGAQRGIIHPMGISRWDGSMEATWEQTVAGLVEVVDHARATGFQLCLENNVHYWDGIPDETLPEQADRGATNHIFGSTPAEWRDLWRAVGREELRLCLDTSHAATYAARSSDPAKAEQLLGEFLAQPELIAHVHWSDSWLCDPRGRRDAHLPVGTGTLPRAFHARVKALDATKHLEHKATPPQLRAELTFIEGL
ncbi:MAG: sugar phosphate isomerase/epimerase [Chloroflexi bacterium]|nr:sugar phosphate isomerase/epimerase [Chloroflexota bacterium]